MRRYIFFVLLACIALPFKAQDDYHFLKQRMDGASLPLINIRTDSVINKNGFVDGIIDIADYQCRTDFFTDSVSFFCKIRYRGTSALNYSKKSFSIKIVDRNGKDLDVNLFGIRQENSWILDAMAVDRIRMRNRICFDVWNDLDKTPYNTKYGNRNGTSGLFVEVFINGVYEGLYCLSDKIDRKLLGLKKAQTETNGDVSVKGIIYKGISWDGYSTYLLGYDDTYPVDGVVWNEWELEYPSDYPSARTWQPLMDLIDFCSQTNDNTAFLQGYQDYFYLDNLINYFVFTQAMNVGDNFCKNTFLSTVDLSDSHRYLVTPWDMDMSLGSYWDGGYRTSMCKFNRYDETPPFDKLYVRNLDGFRDRIADKWADCCLALFSPDSIISRLDHYAEQLMASGAWEREYNRWNGSPVALKESVFDELEFVKDWYIQNYNWICSNLGGTPYVKVFAPKSGVKASALYMLDGRRLELKEGEVPPRGIYIRDGKKVAY